MKVATATLEKMAAATRRPAGQRRCQFSILAILVLTTTASVVLVGIKPHWQTIKESLRPKVAVKQPNRVIRIVEPPFVQPAEPPFLLPVEPVEIRPPRDRRTNFACMGCGRG